jgi:hypothetical protein
MRTRPGKLRIIIVLLAAVLLMREAYLLAAIHYPSLLKYLPRQNLRRMRHFYADHIKAVIQYMPGCGRYDKELSYTLNPGIFILKDVEFENRYYVNSLGVRDSEEALTDPEIVVLGDSHAMGNGVSQDDAFPQVLRKISGLSVLNTGVSSYGTVRELGMLRRVDKSHMRFLIIQYCDNDILENRVLRDNGNRLPIMSEADYDRICRIEKNKRIYFPGKYTLYAFYDYMKRKLGRLFLPKSSRTEEPALNAEDEVELFLNTLANSGTDLTRANIIVVRTINRDDSRRSTFIARLKEKISGDYPASIKGMRAIDCADLLSENDFFLLDDHMKPSGHKKVAQALLALIH